MTAVPHFLRLRDVLARIGLSRSTVYLLEARGEFPKRVRLGLNSVAWLASEVDAWMQSRLDRRLAFPVADAAAT